MIPKLSNIPEVKRKALAEKVHDLKDFRLPELKYWNYDPCDKHDEITQGCNECAIIFRKHQRVGIAWLYLAKKALLADIMGSGKTIHAAGLLTLCKETGELGYENKALIVCRAPAIMQWQSQLNRMITDVEIKTATGIRKNRIDTYLSSWDICVIGQQMLVRDYEALSKFSIQTLIIDDIDALRNRQNKTAVAIKKIALNCGRVIVMTGTPLQKRLPELHSVLETIGGREIFGSPTAFKHRYIQTEKVPIYINGGRRRYVERSIGYQNIGEFTHLVKPLALRRTADDIDDVNMPAVNPLNVWLEFTPAQKSKYDELKTGVLKILRESGTEVKRTKALAQLLYGAQICTGLATLGEADLPNTSCKLDWLEDKLVEGDLSDEKVVVFMQFRNSIRAFSKRLETTGIGHEIIWGLQPNKEIREQSRLRFWNDDNCRILLGSASIEQSIDLQVARHLVNVDTILNPARMAQLAGRVRRDGSRYNNVYVHNLLVLDSQEERYLPTLQKEQALIDKVWDEKSELFDSLEPSQLLKLITG